MGAGNDAFRDGTVWGAQTAVDAWAQGILALERLTNLRKYRVPDLDAEPIEDDPPWEEVCVLQLTLRLNIAQALLKLRQFETCILHCDAALDLDPTSKKALWRKAQAVWGIRNPGLAREALNRLLEVDDHNPAAIAMLQEIEIEEKKKLAKRAGPGVRHKPRVVSDSSDKKAANSGFSQADERPSDASSTSTRSESTWWC